MDDLNDHWTADVHLQERKAFILRLQELAKTKNLRVTFVAGDVHCCGAGRLASQNPEIKNIEQDHRYMVQVISSAIVNVPPPNAVIRGVHFMRQEFITSMIPRMRRCLNFSRTMSIMARDRQTTIRSCSLAATFHPFVENHETGALIVNIHVQREDNQGTAPYAITIPKLAARNTAWSLVSSYI